MPAVIECNTKRLGRHKQLQCDLRSVAEMTELAMRDPLRNVDRSLYRDAEEQVAQAIEAAMRSPDPVLPKF